MVLPFWKRVWQFLKISNLESPHDPAIPLLWLNPNTCAHMFTPAQFPTAKWGKPPKWPSISNQTDTHPHSGIWLSHEKEWSSDTGYSVDGPWTHDTQWEKQTQEDTQHVIPFIGNVPNRYIHKEWKWVCGGLGDRGGEWVDGWMMDGWMDGWWMDGWTWKVVAEPWKTPGFLASGGEEFNLRPETKLDHSELQCNKVLLKHKRDRESFWHRHQKAAERVPPC